MPRIRPAALTWPIAILAAATALSGCAPVSNVSTTKSKSHGHSSTIAASTPTASPTPAAQSHRDTDFIQDGSYSFTFSYSITAETPTIDTADAPPGNTYLKPNATGSATFRNTTASSNLATSPKAYYIVVAQYSPTGPLCSIGKVCSAVLGGFDATGVQVAGSSYVNSWPPDVTETLPFVSTASVGTSEAELPNADVAAAEKELLDPPVIYVVSNSAPGPVQTCKEGSIGASAAVVVPAPAATSCAYYDQSWLGNWDPTDY